jgi:hypothetical protein
MLYPYNSLYLLEITPPPSRHLPQFPQSKISISRKITMWNLGEEGWGSAKYAPFG